MAGKLGAREHAREIITEPREGGCARQEMRGLARRGSPGPTGRAAEVVVRRDLRVADRGLLAEGALEVGVEGIPHGVELNADRPGPMIPLLGTIGRRDCRHITLRWKVQPNNSGMAARTPTAILHEVANRWVCSARIRSSASPA